MNTTHTNLRKSVALLTVLAMTMMAFSAFFAQSVSAGGISAMSVTDNADFTSNSFADLSTATTAATTLNFTLATDHDLDGHFLQFNLNGFTETAAIVAGDLTLTCSNGAQTLEASPGTADNDAHEVTVSTGTNGEPVILIVLDNVDNTPTPPACDLGAATLVIASGELTSEATAGNYPWYITTNFDNGAFLIYLADENDVQIEADVDNVLTFVIRNSDDTADQANVDGLGVGPNLCDLGNLSTAGVQECEYRLKITTNANSGYYVTVTLDDDLNNSGDTEFIDNIADGAEPLSGTEGYNILLDAGETSIGGTVTPCDGTLIGGTACTAVGPDFSDATGTVFGPDADADYLTGLVMYDVDGPNSPTATDTDNTALVTHRAEADSGTPAGTYTQLATYTVTARW